MKFLFAEQIDMLFIYGETQNSTRAQALYIKRYPDQMYPSHRMCNGSSFGNRNGTILSYVIVGIYRFEPAECVRACVRACVIQNVIYKENNKISEMNFM